MKKLNFIIFFVCVVLFVFGQNRAYPPKHLKNLAVKNIFPNEWKTQLKSGMYFYTVKANENSVTKKMVVE